MNTQRYSYTQHNQFPVGMPLVDLKLSYNDNTTQATALVDSGASLNILPYDIGIELGLDWGNQSYQLELGGILSGSVAYAVLLDAELFYFEPVKLAFAWVNVSRPNVRVLLGQVNFFQTFDVHFYGHEGVFEISTRLA
ncbi:MAG: hypothetical protein AAF639_19240 [Chloroflexota bacterium]